MGRYWLSGFTADQMGQTFPWGTLAVNILGSFAIGFFAALTGPDGRLFIGASTRQFVMIGVFGGFTTFSSFGLETLNLAHDGQWPLAGAYVAASIIVCLIAVWVGDLSAGSLNQLRGA